MQVYSRADLGSVVVFVYLFRGNSKEMQDKPRKKVRLVDCIKVTAMPEGLERINCYCNNRNVSGALCNIVKKIF